MTILSPILVKIFLSRNFLDFANFTAVRENVLPKIVIVRPLSKVINSLESIENLCTHFFKFYAIVAIVG